MKNKSRKQILNLTLSAMFLAIALFLPFLTGQIQAIGERLCPMHIPVLLCGFICGWKWGLVVGAASPILRSFIFHMPVFYPMAVCMAFELAAYGAIAGAAYKALPKKNAYVYVSLLLSMISGRIVWGAARFICAGLNPSKFGLSAFWTKSIVDAVPGIILQIVLIPAIIILLKQIRILPIEE